jgi:branched-subunit amino acid transport protein
MICRQCGTEIADKALICYRCGTATTEPRVRPPSARRQRSALPALLALLALVLAGLFMGQAATGEAPRYIGYVIAGLAAVALVWRWLRR